MTEIGTGVRSAAARTEPDTGREAAVAELFEVHHLPLQPVGNYRRRSLEYLSEWLPREKLYAMPRSLQTQGSRALGRLAFVDNQARLMARFKREIADAMGITAGSVKVHVSRGMAALSRVLEERR